MFVAVASAAKIDMQMEILIKTNLISPKHKVLYTIEKFLQSIIRSALDHNNVLFSLEIHQVPRFTTTYYRKERDTGFIYSLSHLQVPTFQQKKRMIKISSQISRNIPIHQRNTIELGPSFFFCQLIKNQCRRRIINTMRSQSRYNHLLAELPRPRAAPRIRAKISLTAH